MKVQQRKNILSLKRQKGLEPENLTDDEWLPSLTETERSGDSSHQWKQNNIVFDDEMDESPAKGEEEPCAGETSSAKLEEPQEADEICRSPEQGPSGVQDRVADSTIRDEPEFLADEVKCNSPQPGPSGGNVCMSAMYEDISFEPQITSTPRSDDNEKKTVCERLHLRSIRQEIRDGKIFIKQAANDFLGDIKGVITRKSKKHIKKLVLRRNKVSKKILKLKQQKNLIDSYIDSLSNEKAEVEDAIHFFKYFADNLPV